MRGIVDLAQDMCRQHASRMKPKCPSPSHGHICCLTQVLTKLATEMWLATGAAYKAGDAEGLAEHGGRLLQLLLDMDTLLASVP